VSIFLQNAYNLLQEPNLTSGISLASHIATAEPLARPYLRFWYNRTLAELIFRFLPRIWSTALWFRVFGSETPRVGGSFARGANFYRLERQRCSISNRDSKPATGQKRSRLRVIGENLQLLGNKEDGGAPTTPAPPSKWSTERSGIPEPNFDDAPF
jgi:hypothetical protein